MISRTRTPRVDAISATRYLWAVLTLAGNWHHLIHVRCAPFVEQLRATWLVRPLSQERRSA